MERVNDLRAYGQEVTGPGPEPRKLRTSPCPYPPPIRKVFDTVVMGGSGPKALATCETALKTVS